MASSKKRAPETLQDGDNKRQVSVNEEVRDPDLGVMVAERPPAFWNVEVDHFEESRRRTDRIKYRWRRWGRVKGVRSDYMHGRWTDEEKGEEDKWDGGYECSLQ